MGKILTIITHSPYGTENAFAAIAMIATAPVADLEGEVVLASGGVFSAIKEQNPSGPLKSHKASSAWKEGIPSIESLIEETIELGVNFAALDRDLEVRGIKKEELIENISVISIEELSDKILECDTIFVF